MSIAPVTQTTPNLVNAALATGQDNNNTSAAVTATKTIVSQTMKTSASGVVTTTITYSDGTTAITVSGGDEVTLSGKKAA